jgi:putative intracellular protease/amidase
MAGNRVLIVATSHGEMGSTGHRTGVWLEELAVPYYALLDGGAEVTLASVQGGQIPFDPRSLPAEAGRSSAGEQPAEQQDIPAAVRRFLDDPTAMDAARNSPSVDEVEGSRFDAVLLPGGHGTMWDLPESEALARLVGSSYAGEGRIVATVATDRRASSRRAGTTAAPSLRAGRSMPSPTARRRRSDSPGSCRSCSRIG